MNQDENSDKGRGCVGIGEYAGRVNLSGTVIEPLSRTTHQQRLLGRIHAANGNKQLPLYATSSFIEKPANGTAVAKRRSCEGKGGCPRLTDALASAGALAAVASSSGGSSCMRSADSESSLYSATETSASSTHHSRYKDATLTTICGDSEIVSMKGDDDTLNSTTVIGQIDVHRKRSLVVADDDDNATPTMRTLTVTVQVHAEPTC